MPWHKRIGEQSDGVEDRHGRLLTDRDDSDYHRRSFTAEAEFSYDGGLRSGCDRSAIVVFGFTGYTTKYGNAWRAKQLALEIRWGSWNEAYNRVLRILCAMAHYNPGLRWFPFIGGRYFLSSTGEKTHVLQHVFWCFAQTEQSFHSCRTGTSDY